MRFLHTSDWHVGKTLRGRSRADEHRAVLAEIAALVSEAEIDVVLVGGDLFESSSPTAESEEIVYRALLDLAGRSQAVVVISGNHDNPRRLDAIRPLLRFTNIHALARLARPSDGGVLHLATSSGEASIALFPFLSQRSIVTADELMSADAAAHASTYADRASRIVERLCAALPPGGVQLFLGHAMVHGGVLGGGERSAHTIFEYSVPTTCLPGALHYAALGHLHRAQKLPGACPIWFSGSPLQLDFGEGEDVKSVNVIEAAPDLPAKVETVPLSSGKKLRTVRGKLADLDWLSPFDGYLRVVLNEAPRPGLAETVRERLPNAVDVRLAPDSQRSSGEDKPQRLGRSPGELFQEYLVERGEDDERVRALFHELFEEMDASRPA